MGEKLQEICDKGQLIKDMQGKDVDWNFAGPNIEPDWPVIKSTETLRENVRTLFQASTLQKLQREHAGKTDAYIQTRLRARTAW